MSKVLFSLSQNNTVATITLNKPENNNCLDLDVILDLNKYLTQISKDSIIKVVVLTSNGDNFCTGVDLSWMHNAINHLTKKKFQDLKKLANLLLCLYKLPKLVICVVKGNVYGGGIGLVACADLVIAAENSKFCFPEVKLGLAPAIISQFVLRVMNIGFSKYSMLSAKPFDAQKAFLFGLVHEVVSIEKIQQTALNNIENILSLDFNAVITTKKILQKKFDIDVHQLNKFTEIISDLTVREDVQQLIKKFLDRKNK